MGLGARFWEWLDNIPLALFVKAYKNGFVSRLNDVNILLQQLMNQANIISVLPLAGVLVFAALVYLVTSWRLPLDFLVQAAQVSPGAGLDEFSEDPSLYLARKLREAAGKPGARELAEIVGSLITDPVLALFESYATNPSPDVHEFSRAFHGYMVGLGWAGAGIDATLKASMGERAPQVAPHLTGIYWSLGLGFLGWQTLAPLLSAGLQPNLERHYNKLYRPQRFNASQMRDLLALGKVSVNGFYETMRETGWRDEDIALWQNISYRDLSEGIIFDAFERGLIGQFQLETRLRALGYNPLDIPLVIQLHGREDEGDATRYLASTAKAALKAGKIDVGEFRQILTGLRYAPREIDLQIQLLTTQQQEEARELTTGQIKQLYDARIIASSEAVFNLTSLGYSGDVASKLVSAWDAQNLPRAARINRGTIIEGYINGALARSEALDLLQREAGYSPQNAELILKIEEASLAQQAPETITGGPAVSLSLLIQFAQNGLITRAQMEQRAELARFTPTDRAAFIDLAFVTPITAPALLTPEVLLDAFRRGVISADVLRAKLATIGITPEDVELLIALQPAELPVSLLSNSYIFGVITRDDFASRLRGAGLTDEDIEVFIRTIELENPQVFGEFTQAFLRQASVGSLQLALQRGLITEQVFRDRLAGQGYSVDAIEVYTFNAQYQEPANPKSLTKTDILRLYRENRLTRSQAQMRLIQEGYNIADAQLLLSAEEQSPADTEIGQAYMAGFIDEFGASAALTNQGFSFEEIENFFIAVAAGTI